MATADFSEQYSRGEVISLAADYAKKYPAHIEGWKNFLRTCKKFTAPFGADAFYTFGRHLIELGYVSAGSYAQRAYYWEGYKNPSGLQTTPQTWEKMMESVQARLKEVLDVEISQAVPLRLKDVLPLPPEYQFQLLWASQCGCRPAALERAGDKCVVARDASGVIREIEQVLPLDKRVDSRTVRVFCTCAEFLSPCCPVHAQLPFNDHNTAGWLPVTGAKLTKAIKKTKLASLGYTTYSPRRAAACAISNMVSSKLGKHLKGLMKENEQFAARLNCSFGWVSSSDMVLHYAKNAESTTPMEQQFWKPLFDFLVDGATALRSVAGASRIPKALAPATKRAKAVAEPTPKTRASAEPVSAKSGGRRARKGAKGKKPK
jgi:hypothetical protein